LPFQGVDAEWKCADISGHFVFMTQFFMPGITFQDEVLVAISGTWEVSISLAMQLLSMSSGVTW
jgi:hypothetical protein